MSDLFNGGRSTLGLAHTCQLPKLEHWGKRVSFVPYVLQRSLFGKRSVQKLIYGQCVLQGAFLLLKWDSLEVKSQMIWSPNVHRTRISHQLHFASSHSLPTSFSKMQLLYFSFKWDWLKCVLLFYCANESITAKNYAILFPSQHTFKLTICNSVLVGSHSNYLTQIRG